MTTRVKRSYDSSRRLADAAARRAAVLDVADRLFGELGFAATTIATIAQAAGVSPETVYKQFGGKAGIVRALFERAVQGEGPVPAYERSERLRSGTDPDAIARGWATLAREVGPRVSRLLLLVRDASLVDPSLRELLDELDEANHRRMADNARFLARAGHLRPGISRAEAADVLWALTSAELYELLVVRRGWSVKKWSDHLYRGIVGILR
jgi:AcrR family transcriptional regulator